MLFLLSKSALRMEVGSPQSPTCWGGTRTMNAQPAPDDPVPTLQSGRDVLGTPKK